MRKISQTFRKIDWWQKASRPSKLYVVYNWRKFQWDTSCFRDYQPVVWFGSHTRKYNLEFFAKSLKFFPWLCLLILAFDANGATSYNYIFPNFNLSILKLVKNQFTELKAKIKRLSEEESSNFSQISIRIYYKYHDTIFSFLDSSV